MVSRVARTPARRWLFRNIGWIAASALVAAVAFLPSTPTVLGSAPPGHKVVICHATPPDTAAQGWNVLTVDVASVGYRHAGHASEHDADIIPPYSYGGFDFSGKNWTPEGQAIWANDCRAVTPTPTATPTDVVGPTATPADDEEPTATPSGEVLPTEGTNPTPTGEVKPATGSPTVTLPPTDTAVTSLSPTAPVVLVVVAALLAASAALAIDLRFGRRPG